MENPKLALIPSGYKTSKVYSILPNSGDGDFDFSRASSGTRVTRDGLIETVGNNVPRLDWLNRDCPVLLLEKESTNLQVYSEDFSNAAWSKNPACTITSNTSIAPNGTLTADTLVGDGSTTSYVFDSYSVSFDDLYAISVFVKKINVSSFEIRVFGTNGGFVTFDLDAKTSSTTYSVFESHKIEDYGNGWFRCSVVYNPPSSFSMNYGFGVQNYSGEHYYLWGAQLEYLELATSGFASSYIKTEASSVTRSEDFCNDGGDATLFSSIEGTMFVDLEETFKDSSFGRVSISNSSTSNRLVIGKQTNNTQFRMFIQSSGSVVAQHYVTADFDVRNKLAITYRNDEFKFYHNGVLLSTDTSGDVPTGLNAFSFNENNLGSQDFFGLINEARYYDRVLTEAEAKQLTTI